MPTFLLDPAATFLNHGSFGACPREILAVQDAYRQTLERQPVDFLARRLPGLLNEARAAVAPFLGTQTDGLVFVPNATTAIAAVLASHPLKDGDELVTTNHRYDAVFNAMVRRAEGAGARVVQARLPWPVVDRQQQVDAVVSALSPRTRLLVIDQITSATALVLPVQSIIAEARRRGIAVLVDGAHAPGQIDVQLDALGADWWVGNLHKWVCAPKGAAMLWAAPHRRATTLPIVPSHGVGQGYHDEFDWPGTFDPTAWLAVPEALALHAHMGGAIFREAHHTLVQEGRQVVAAAIDRPLPHPDNPSMYAAMASISLGVPAEHAVAINNTLWNDHRVEVPVSPFDGDTVLRISGFAAYNKPADYEHLAAVLPAVLAAFR